MIETKSRKVSKHDSDSGWFHKGDHKQFFAYNVQTTCDRNGWVLGYSVHAGNVHDTQAFPSLWEKVSSFHPEYVVADAGYQTPSIAHHLLERHVTPAFPYTRPRMKAEHRKKITQ